jgi:hypothetical protein
MYDGESRMSAKPEVSLEEKILQFIADAGETGTSSSAIRTRLGGSKDIIDAALIELKDKFYCDGKRGAGKHIWDLKYKPAYAAESSEVDDADDCNEGGLAAA